MRYTIANAINKAAKSDKYKMTRQGVRDIMCRMKNQGELFSSGFVNGELVYTTENPSPQQHRPIMQPGIIGVRIYKHDTHGNRIVVNG